MPRKTIKSSSPADLYVSSLTATSTGNQVTFNAGTLSAGTIVYSNGQDFVVGDGTDAATLVLTSGKATFQNALTINSNATLKVNGNTTITTSSGGLTIGSGGTLGGTGRPEQRGDDQWRRHPRTRATAAGC